MSLDVRIVVQCVWKLWT